MHLQSVRGTQCCCVHLLRWCLMCSYHSITSTCDSVFFLHELSLPCRTWPRKEEDVLLTCYMAFGENLKESLRWCGSCCGIPHVLFFVSPILRKCFLGLYQHNTDHYVMIHRLYWSSTDGAMGPARLHFDSPKFVSCWPLVNSQFKIRSRFMINNTQIVFLWTVRNFHWL